MENVITNENGQLRSCVGPVAVDAFRLRVLISSLELEIKGMRMSRHMSALQAAKNITGLKTNKRELHIAKAREMLAARIEECTVVTDGVTV